MREFVAHSVDSPSGRIFPYQPKMHADLGALDTQRCTKVPFPFSFFDPATKIPIGGWSLRVPWRVRSCGWCLNGDAIWINYETIRPIPPLLRPVSRVADPSIPHRHRLVPGRWRHKSRRPDFRFLAAATGTIEDRFLRVEDTPGSGRTLLLMSQLDRYRRR